MNNKCVVIAGAGVSGLAAAIVLARGGHHCRIRELRPDVGHRFHGDFQGLENWTAEEDVLEELSRAGVEPDFPAHPVCEAVVYDPDGREYACRSPEALFYLVRRGSGENTLDSALMHQAMRLGVEFAFNDACANLPDGGIVAQGPHRPDVIAAGWTFDTPRPDGAFVALAERLAPGGYAYLLIQGGRGTVATCMFRNFHDERSCLERAVAFFEERAGLKMVNPRRFGGTGNFSIPETARKEKLLRVGESAGFQDAFAGFGMRYALRSGCLAARAIMAGRPEDYDRWWKHHLGPLLRASVVNRYLYGMFGDGGYRRFLRGVPVAGDARPWLRRRYSYSFAKSVVFPLARRSFGRSLKGLCVEPGCSCTWCRCQHGDGPTLS